MFNMGSAPSLSDIAAVTKDGNGDGWGNGNGWWVLIILFAIFGGWGNGWGGQGRNVESCATNGDLQRGFDTQSILNKLNGINGGICDGFYAMNTGMLQSTNALQSAISDSANASNIANLQSTNAIQTQLADCCCQNRQGQAQIQYDMATNTCAITNAISNQTRDIIDNDNANYRALHDEMVKMQMEAKDQTIASQQAAINISQINTDNHTEKGAAACQALLIFICIRNTVCLTEHAVLTICSTERLSLVCTQ